MPERGEDEIFDSLDARIESFNQIAVITELAKDAVDGPKDPETGIRPGRRDSDNATREAVKAALGQVKQAADNPDIYAGIAEAEKLAFQKDINDLVAEKK